ncbi:MAG: hypothetical protein M3Z66_14955 [Chloroflexota bacterium]|nr:hypothetical protein [Chloroflexota bacterium]
MNPFTIAAALSGTAVAGYMDSVMLRGFHADILGVHLGPVDTIFMGCGVAVLLGAANAVVGLRGRPRPCRDWACRYPGAWPGSGWERRD